MHADSQETVGYYRKTVQKITPESMGKFHVIAAGSGPGDLIDSFIIRLRRAFEADTSTEISHFVEVTERTLADFYAFDVSLSSLPDDDKFFKFIFAASCPSTGTYGAWFSANVTLCPMQSFELAGWDEPLYVNVGRRFYTKGISIAQAVLAGVYLMTIAEGTSQYVRGPISVAIIRDNGIWMEDADYITEMEARLRDYEQKINQVFLACADTSIHVHNLEAMLTDFATAALALHRGHIDSTVSLESLLKTNDPYPKRPLGSVVTGMADGRLVFEHDPEKLRRKLEQFEGIRQMGLAAPHYLRCIDCSAELEYMLANPGHDRGPGTLNCPECGTHLRSPMGKARRVRKIGTAEWRDVPDPSSPPPQEGQS